MVSIVLALVLVTIFMVVGGNTEEVLREDIEVIENFNNPSLIGLEKKVVASITCKADNKYTIAMEDIEIFSKLAKNTKIDVRSRIDVSETGIIGSVALPDNKIKVGEFTYALKDVDELTPNSDVLITLTFWKYETETSCYYLNRKRQGSVLLDTCPNSYLGSIDIIVPKEKIETGECATIWKIQPQSPHGFPKRSVKYVIESKDNIQLPTELEKFTLTINVESVQGDSAIMSFVPDIECTPTHTIFGTPVPVGCFYCREYDPSKKLDEQNPDGVYHISSTHVSSKRFPTIKFKEKTTLKCAVMGWIFSEDPIVITLNKLDNEKKIVYLDAVWYNEVVVGDSWSLGNRHFYVNTQQKQEVGILNPYLVYYEYANDLVGQFHRFGVTVTSQYWDTGLFDKSWTSFLRQNTLCENVKVDAKVSDGSPSGTASCGPYTISVKNIDAAKRIVNLEILQPKIEGYGGVNHCENSVDAKLGKCSPFQGQCNDDNDYCEAGTKCEEINDEFVCCPTSMTDGKCFDWYQQWWKSIDDDDKYRNWFDNEVSWS